MKNRAEKTVAAMIVIPLVLIIAVYVFFAFFYKNTFCVGTWINGNYLTGMTIRESEKSLGLSNEESNFTIIDRDGEKYCIPWNTVDYKRDYSTQLEQIMKSQNKLLWGYYFVRPDIYTIYPTITMDKKKSIEEIKKLPVYKESKHLDSPDIEIVQGADGYELVDDTVGAVDPEKLVNAILQSMENGENQIDLRKVECDKKYILSEKMKETKNLFQKIEAIQSTKIIYRMNDSKLELTRKEIADWLVVDENGEFVLDEMGDLTISENKVEDFTLKLTEVFDSIGKPRDWKAESGRKVSVDNATYGFKVDIEAEKEQLIASVLNGIDQEREPFSRAINVDIGTGEIGDTYIEVDMSAQMLYYYVDGVLTVKTPVVTGNTSRGRGTPEKICYVYMKQKNRTLKGANYSAFVNYWMPVLGNIGLHDAGWRKEFGGKIYETNGSHGCINLPKEAAAKIYDMVEVGTPVVMYY